MPSHTIPHIIVRPSGPDVPTERAKRVECLTSPLPSHCDAGRTAEEYGESRCPHAAARASAAHSSPSAVAHGLEGIGTAGTMGVICWQSRSTMARICAVVLSAHTPEPSAPAAVSEHRQCHLIANSARVGPTEPTLPVWPKPYSA